MDRLSTAPPAEEATQRPHEQTEALEVVVVRHLASEPLPDRLDRVQFGTVGRQEAEPQAGLAGDELDEAGTAMPGRAIENDDHQYRGVRPQEWLEEPSEVGRGQPGRQPAMEPAGGRVERTEPMDLLMRPGPVAGQRLLAGEPPLPAERGRQLDGDFVLEEHGQAVRNPMRETQEPTDAPFFSRRRQAGTVGS